jgi:hypothetical protein
MSATIYGIDTGTTLSVDLSSATVDGSFTDISELVLGGNVLIALTNAQFTNLLDISVNGIPETGKVSLDETALKTIITRAIDGTHAGTTYENYNTGVDTIAGGTVSIEAFPGSGSVAYNFSEMIESINDRLSTGTADNILLEVAAQVVGLSGAEYFGPNDAVDNLVLALVNSGVVPNVSDLLDDNLQLLGKDVSAADYINDSNAISFTDSSTTNKERLFNSLLDAGYVADDGLGSFDISFDNEFALAIPMTLKGGAKITLQYANDISFVDASTGLVVDTADASALQGELRNKTITAATTIAESFITDAISGVQTLANTGDPDTDSIRFNLLLIAKNNS